MGDGRIRRATLVVGQAVPNLADISWNDQYEYDRSRSDDQFAGKPVLMKKGGRGNIVLLAGNIASGVQGNDWVATYNQVTPGQGNVEAVVPKTVTFKDVTTNTGGSVPAEGKGEKRIEFEYSESVEA